MIFKNEINLTKHALNEDDLAFLRAKLKAHAIYGFNFFVSVGSSIFVDESNDLKVTLLGGQNGRARGTGDYLPDAVAIVHKDEIVYLECWDEVTDALTLDGAPAERHVFTIIYICPYINFYSFEHQQAILAAFVAAQTIFLNRPRLQIIGRKLEIIVNPLNTTYEQTT